MKRKDERDTIFARMNYREGSAAYQDYYSANPDKKETDDELRSRPALLSRETPYYNEFMSPAAEANFELISDIRRLAEGRPSDNRTAANPMEMSKLLKRLAVQYGALDSGIAIIDRDFYYSKRGRQVENYGEEVDTSLGNAIVFTVEMDDEAIKTAPATDSVIETSAAYVRGAFIGLQLSYYIRRLGYSARCHMDGNYLMPVIPVAIEAGLGEVGRNGLLITRAKGCFCRIGVVTTDLPLAADGRNDLNIEGFCRICRQCIRTCPAKTITSSDTPEDWHIEQEKCYGVWRNLGTDCGICITACPLGQDIPVEEIKGMSDEEMAEYMKCYRDRYGTRQRRINYIME